MVYLVIVESPNKINKISKILGSEFKVMASIGHIRDLPKKEIGIDLNTYDAKYEITKPKVVRELKNSIKNVKTVYIATDPDREGEGIAWHLMEVLKLSYPKAKRMTFNEITKSAILLALEEANQNGRMNMNIVNSYKARRFVDKITGFKASPLLWKNVEGAKSAGRVQSVTTRLIIDKEDSINKHNPEEKYLISGIFLSDKKDKINGTLKQIPDNHKEALQILNYCKISNFLVSGKKNEKVEHSPKPPFKTSVYQQETGNRFNISPSNAMRIAQHLYEKGKITYHRTDVTRLSDEFKNDAKNYILNKYGEKYLSKELNNDLNNKKKGEQAAHEAIRPTDINMPFLIGDFENSHKNVYRMIWCRAVASIMSNELCEKYSVIINISECKEYFFTSSYLETIFLGFKVLDDKKIDLNNKCLKSIDNGDFLKYENIESKQTFTSPPSRYTESSLVKELEKKGIGRPSTYANIISTVQDRGYCIKMKSPSDKKDCFIDILIDNRITNKVINIDISDKKQRLFPTELGTNVTSFLISNLDYMMDYNFTSTLENDLDNISNENKDWIPVVDNLTKHLEKLINIIPIKEISYNRITKGKYNQNMDQNNKVGLYNDNDIIFYVGKYGPFVKYDNNCYSLPKECTDISKVTLEIAIKSIQLKMNRTETKSFLVSHQCEIGGKKGNIQGLTGQYGNYLKFIADDGETKTYFLPTNMKNNNELVSNLTLDACLEQVEFVKNYKKSK